MVRIKGSSGLVIGVPADIAEALVRSGDAVLVEDEPKAPAKKSAARPSSKK